MDCFRKPKQSDWNKEIIKICERYSLTLKNLQNSFKDYCLKCDPIVGSICSEVFSFKYFDLPDDAVDKYGIEKLVTFIFNLVAGETSFSVYGEKLKEYDYSTRCGLVWTINYFAYRCRTCSLSPSMSLCGDCFNAGDHEGHDFNKFKSQAGGACDCGDAYVMKEAGFCPHHGANKAACEVVPPASLVAPLQAVMPSVLAGLVYQLWQSLLFTSAEQLSERMEYSSQILSFLHTLQSFGWVTQKMIATLLIDTNLFNKFLNDIGNSPGYKTYQKAMVLLKPYSLPEDKVGPQTLQHKTMLDGLLFACVQLRFPENLLTFLIGLLTVEEYKLQFVNSYLDHYSRMTAVVNSVALSREDAIPMNNRIVHISVQLFSGEVLALRMVKERKLHYLILHCMLGLLNSCKKKLDQSGREVINCENGIIKNNGFWPLISDFINLVSHKSVVDIFVKDQDFLADWTNTLKLLQLINMYIYQEQGHVEFESNTVFNAYTIEIEVSSNPMWNIWMHYRPPEEKANCLLYTRAMLKGVGSHLEGIMDILDDDGTPLRCSHGLSFHLPLQRHAACFTSLALVQHGVTLEEIGGELNYLQLQKWLWWTLRTLLGSCEVSVGLWARNGLQVRTSALYYVQSQFCYSLIDLDIFAAQLCSSILDPQVVLSALIDRELLLRGVVFDIEHPFGSRGGCLTSPSAFSGRSGGVQLDKEPQALESWFMTLAWILDLRNNMGIPEELAVRKELICQLAPEPRKRSDINILLPERCGIYSLVSDVDTILNEIATYSGPSYDEASGNMQSGLYTLRSELWTREFDPIFQSLRSVQRRDYVKSMQKFREHCKTKGLYTKTNQPWPPFLLPGPLHPQLAGINRLLHSRDLHYIFYTCLTLFIYGDPQMTEDSLALLIHLLRRAVLTPSGAPGFASESVSIFQNNPFLVDDLLRNLVLPVAPTGDTFLSLLLKCHSRLLSVSSSASEGGATATGSQEGALPSSSSTVESLAGVRFFERFPLSFYLQGPVPKAGAESPVQGGSGAHATASAEDIVGDGPVYVEQLLNTICNHSELCAAYLNDFLRLVRNDSGETDFNCMGQDSSSCQAGKRSTDEMSLREEKKRKAQERQKRLMKQMASKQKAFAYTHLKDIMMMETEDPYTPEKESEDEELFYECVICQIKSSVNDAANHMEVLGYATPTGLSREMRRSSTIPSLSATNTRQLRSGIKMDTRYHIAHEVSLQLMDGGGTGQNSMRSAIIQSCGHFVHDTCYGDYRKQRLHMGTGRRLRMSCPLCRRDVNHLIPLYPNPKLARVGISSFVDAAHFINTIATTRVYPQCRSSPINDAHDSLSFFSNDNHEEYSTTIFHNPASLLRNQIDMEIIVARLYPQQYSSLMKKCSWREYICYILSLTEQERANGQAKYSPLLLYELTGVPCDSSLYEPPISFGNMESLSLLARDPIDVFLTWIPCTWPSTEAFQFLLEACFNLAYVRAILSQALEITPANWQKLKEEESNSCPEDLASHISSAITCLASYWHKMNTTTALGGSAASGEEAQTTSSSRPRYHFQQDLTTPGLLVKRIKRHLVAFLRIAAACRSRWHDETFTMADVSPPPCEEFDLLVRQCGLITSSPPSPVDPSVIVTKSRVPISADFSKMLLTWLTPILVNKHLILLLDELLELGTELYPPRLIQLPHCYDDLFNHLHTSKCPECQDGFAENSLCLICGMVICNICNHWPGSHAHECGSGVGLVLEVNTSMIKVSIGRDTGRWGSVYLDTYGEEDIDLRRGKPLFLNKKRFDLLEQQWLSHSFRSVMKDWSH